MAKFKDIVLYGADGTERKLPTCWEICGSCRGDGTTCAHVECDGGGFTSSEWAEQDDDFKEDYIAGRYDRPCDSCGGSGKVQTADFDAMPAADRKAYRAQQLEDANYESMCRMERMVGA